MAPPKELGNYKFGTLDLYIYLNIWPKQFFFEKLL